jgi:N-acetylglucosamine-6-phosphate deacetylase
MEGNFVIEALHYDTGKPVRLEVIKGIIAGIHDIDKLSKDAESLVIAPGLIDDQINGYANVDFSGTGLSVTGISDAATAIRAGGVTTFVPTLITGNNELLIKNLKIFDEACKTDVLLNMAVPGIHLEGPYISAEEGYRGCHPVQYIHDPSWEEFLSFQDSSGGRIIQVTVAPERVGALEFINRCSRDGIVVSIGHTAAPAEVISQAVNEGAVLSTHLGNGCANMIHRHRNPLWAQLANDRLAVSLIADGFHLLPEEMEVFFKVKGPDNMILVSDVIYLAGMAPGKYSFLGASVILTEEGMLLNPELNCLAGASFPLKKGVENMMKMAGCTLSQSVNMASVNVARILGLSERGELAVGKRADLILIELERYSLQIRNVWLNGELVF